MTMIKQKNVSALFAIARSAQTVESASFAAMAHTKVK
jgi:hypothetical protein